MNIEDVKQFACFCVIAAMAIGLFWLFIFTMTHLF